MKNLSKLVIALAVGALCLNGQAFAAQESASEKAKDPQQAETKKASGGGQASGNTTSGGSQETGGQLSAADKAFMMQAAKDGMMEVHMGQMAQQQGQSEQIKKLGKMIEQDHTKANNQLMAIAQKKGVQLDTKHKMSKLDKGNFDQAWLGHMTKEHHKDIAAFQKASQSASDPDVKKFASKTLPVLQKHLKAVQDAQSKMGSGNTTASTKKSS